MALETSEISARLLDWYDRHARVLPWRSAPGEPPADPYHVWLSEIMLQQTTVATVGPYFARFLERWPTLGDLAAAALDDVLHAWAGLGYYARARNLHKCAGVVAWEFGGRFPDTEEALLTLPGVGPYTAAAIAAIAFGRKATVVDGNVERVVARLYALETPLPDAKGEIRARAAELTPDERAGDYAQAMMDLGATLCSPRSPQCDICPLRGDCRGRALGVAESLPRRKPKAERPTRRGDIYWLEAVDPETGEVLVLVRRRDERGLLGGMMGFPGSDWDRKGALGVPLEADWDVLGGEVVHVFTHFRLELTVQRAAIAAPVDLGGQWQPVASLHEIALPTVMKKVAAHVAKAAR